MENNRKVVVRLSGGMGNQLHQYAYALFLAKKTGGDVYIDKSFFKLNYKRLKITKRNYQLHHFSIKAREYHFFLSNYYLFNIFSRLSFLKYSIWKLLKIVIVNSRLPENETYHEEKILYVNGVFGSISEYDAIAEGIKLSFLPNPRFKNLVDRMGEWIRRVNSVAVHIRRTDYLNVDSVHEVLDISFYKTAIGIMKAKMEAPTFYFFGDDEEWIKENFLLEREANYVFINYKGPDAPLFDFFAIQYCENVIISNSTFAWWAAYLNGNKNKFIIAPCKWLKHATLNLTEAYSNDWHVV